MPMQANMIWNPRVIAIVERAARRLSKPNYLYLKKAL
jgi:hypothetical protein